MGRETIPSPDDLLLLPEVAEITRRSIDTLRWLRHRGEGPRGHRSGRRVYYRRRDVMAWLEEQERRAEDAPGRSPQPAALPCRMSARYRHPISPFSRGVLLCLVHRAPASPGATGRPGARSAAQGGTGQWRERAVSRRDELLRAERRRAA